MTIPTSGRSPRSTATAITVVALAAFAGGAAIRLDGLSRRSLWQDEVMTLERVASPSVGSMLVDLEGSPLPPLYYLALRAWCGPWPAGSEEVALRALPALLGVLTPGLTCLIWRGLIGGRAALLAGILVAFNAFHAWYSQDGKMYAAVWLLSTASSGAFLRVIVADGRRAPWLALYAAATAALPMVSYAAVVTPAAQAAFAAALAWARPARRRALGDLAIAATVALATGLPRAGIAWRAARERTGIDWIPPISVWDAPRELASYFGLVLTGAVPDAARWLVLAAIAGLMARHAAASARGGEGEGEGVVAAYLATWSLLPVVGSLAFSAAVYPVWGPPRYLAGAACALPIWAAVALAGRPLPRRWAAAGWGTGLLLVGLNLAMIAFEKRQDTLPPWREVARVAGRAARRGGASPPRPLPIALSAPQDEDAYCLSYALAHPGGGDAGGAAVVTSLAEATAAGGRFGVVTFGRQGSAADEVERSAGVACTAERAAAWRIYNDRRRMLPGPRLESVLEFWVCSPRAPAVAAPHGEPLAGIRR